MNPKLVEMNHCGLTELMTQSVYSFHKNIQSKLLKNILLIGGNFNIPNIVTRIKQDKYTYLKKF